MAELAPSLMENAPAAVLSDSPATTVKQVNIDSKSHMPEYITCSFYSHMSVCNAVTFAKLDLERSFFVYKYISRIFT